MDGKAFAGIILFVGFFVLLELGWAKWRHTSRHTEAAIDRVSAEWSPAGRLAAAIATPVVLLGLAALALYEAYGSFGTLLSVAKAIGTFFFG